MASQIEYLNLSDCKNLKKGDVALAQAALESVNIIFAQINIELITEFLQLNQNQYNYDELQIALNDSFQTNFDL